MLSFAACELRVASRELHVDGREREIEPKVFDVLAYLAIHHDRVVGRRELLDAVWTPGTVSDAVLATSIMKARRAINDNDRDLPIIRTLPRLGYRIAADVTISVADARTCRAGSAPHTLRERIAALPFQNLTGQPELVWIEYGLSALLAQTLAEESNLTVMTTLEVLVLAEGIGRQMTPRTRARLVSATLGAQYVVSTQVRRRGPEFEFEFCVFHDGRILRVGSLRGLDAAALTVQLGAKVCDDVLHCTASRRN